MKNIVKYPLNVFVDTSIVNNLLDLNETRLADATWEANIKFIRILINGPVASGKMSLYVNPSVKHQINSTPNKERRDGLLLKFEEFKFEEFNLTIFPFSFPARFIAKEQGELIDNLCKKYPNLEKDRKIIADAAFNDKIDFLLTTDGDLAHQVRQIGNVRFMLPKELWDHYTSINK
ncbi:hypothetical protein ACFLXL_01830 [Chloroflexota bacterium]